MSGLCSTTFDSDAACFVNWFKPAPWAKREREREGSTMNVQKASIAFTELSPLRAGVLLWLSQFHWTGASQRCRCRASGGAKSKCSCLSWHSICDCEGTCAFPLGDSSQYSPHSAGCKRDTKPDGTGGGIGFPSVSLGIPLLLLAQKTCTGTVLWWYWAGQVSELILFKYWWSSFLNMKWNS